LRRYSRDLVRIIFAPRCLYSLILTNLFLSYDNTWALHQIEEGHHTILTREPATDADKLGPAKKGKTLPRVITLGGDHTITLPLLRSINRAYGPVSVIHFDSHLDTWRPKVFGGSPSEVASINHGTYFYHASQEGLLKNDTNIHAGIRTTLSGPSDYDNDGYCGFQIVEAREIDTIGIDGIIKKISASKPRPTEAPLKDNLLTSYRGEGRYHEPGVPEY
jgi:agmatinase